jgi:hypothetical protein
MTAPDRRQAQRRPVLNTFSVFVVVPKKGLHRLAVHDISENGMGFDLDLAGEFPQEYPAKVGDSVEFRFYLNQSLFIPLVIQIARVEEQAEGYRRIGAEFKEAHKKTQSYKAFLSLLTFLDTIVDELKIDTHGI